MAYDAADLPAARTPSPIVNVMTHRRGGLLPGQRPSSRRRAPATRWDSYASRVEANTDRLLRLFAEARVRATFFVLGWVAERHPALVRRIAAGRPRDRLAQLRASARLRPDAGDFRADLRRARGVIEDRSGAAGARLPAPSYSVTERSLWALDVLIEEGYAYDASIFPIHHDRYGIPSAPRHAHRVLRPAGSLIELPGSTALIGPAKVPIGGGYFRLLPYALTTLGDRPAQPRRPAAGDVLPPSVGDRPGPAAPAPRRRCRAGGTTTTWPRPSRGSAACSPTSGGVADRGACCAARAGVDGAGPVRAARTTVRGRRARCAGGADPGRLRRGPRRRWPAIAGMVHYVDRTARCTPTATLVPFDQRLPALVTARRRCAARAAARR